MPGWCSYTLQGGFEWLLTGLVSGLLDYVFAVGFGLVASIILVVLYGVDPRAVAGTTALAQIPLAIIITHLHFKAGNISSQTREKAGLLPAFFSTTLLGGFLASILISNTAREVVEKLYPTSLVILALIILYIGESTQMRPLTINRYKVALVAVIGLASGVYKALIGGGYSALLLLAQKKLGIDMKSGVALAPLLKVPAFMVIGLVYSLEGYVSPTNLLYVLTGGFLSVPLAVKALRKVKTNNITRVMGATLLLIALAKTITIN